MKLQSMLETCAVAAAAAEQGGAGSADSTGSGVQKGGSGNTHKDDLSRPLRLFFVCFFSVETGKRKKRKLLLHLFQVIGTGFSTLLK